MRGLSNLFVAVFFISIGVSAYAVSPELLWLPFDEQLDMVEDCRVNPHVTAELNNVMWAEGDFGEALYFCGTNALVEVDALPALQGANAFTLSIWVMWQGGSDRKYPNILTSRTWSPGGLMIFVNQDACSFRMGKPDTKGAGWQEVGVPLLNTLPKDKWTHLSVTFERPLITTYVNGKKVASAKWDYPVQCDAIRLGGWGNQVCHRGLMDDLRLYNRVLSAAEIDALATDSKRSSSMYTVHPSKPFPSVADFSNRHVSMSIDKRGRLSQLHCKNSGQSLISASSVLISATMTNNTVIKCDHAVAIDKNRVRFTFAGIKGHVDLKIISLDDFFDIEVPECTVAGVAGLTFFEINSAVNKYRGSMANMLSDDDVGVCLRGYDLPVEMHVGASKLRLQSTKELGLAGWRGGLAAGPREDLPGILKSMTLHAGVPYSVNGGAWSLESEANKGSYLFANLSLASVDDWIELARRCGYETIHLHGWWQRLGHYPINKSLYPKGESDLKEAVRKIHAAGLTAGMHTLTACIHPQDSWVTPKPHPDLLAANSYSLTKDLVLDDDVVTVAELPAGGHDIVFTYSGNGNALRIGDEIIQYTGINREKPYSFTGCKRGAFGTTPANHAIGQTVDYLQQRYYAFYPKPASALAELLSERLAHIFNSCKIDNLYFDGSEGMRSRYGIDSMRHSIMKKLSKNALLEASCHGAHNWWFHSRLGAWDHPVWGMKSFHDKHIAIASQYRSSDLMATQLGWWAPRRANATARGHYLEEMEYFACKNLAMDTASSIQGVNVSHAPLPYYIEEQMTVLGWYERVRRAGYFDEATIARIAAPGEEFELRQNKSGGWQFRPVQYQMHRTSCSESRSWQVVNSFKDQPFTMRIAALQRALPYEDRSAVQLLSSDDYGELETKTASLSLQLIAAVADGERFKGSLKLHAVNNGSSAVGAWVRASRSFAPEYLDISPSGAVGVWVKGDGSGALLNVQLESPREHMQAYSEHYVTLDFKGWRYFEMHYRERDTRLYVDYVWPYSYLHALYRNALNTKYLSRMNIYLNNIPAGKDVNVFISPVKALPVVDEQIVNPVVKVNGESLTLPLTLNSGDFAEVDSTGMCTRFDKGGNPLECVKLAKKLRFKAGNNRVELLQDASVKRVPRAEVTSIVYGTAFGGMNRPSEIKEKYLQRLYEMPRMLKHSGTEESHWDISLRPGHKAVAEIELHGPVMNPVLSINGALVTFDVTIKKGERLICRDQQNWHVINNARVTLSKGTLKSKVPILHAGTNQIIFKSDGPCNARLNIVTCIQ